MLLKTERVFSGDTDHVIPQISRSIISTFFTPEAVDVHQSHLPHSKIVEKGTHFLGGLPLIIVIGIRRPPNWRPGQEGPCGFHYPSTDQPAAPAPFP